jgi:hypothetical protein
LFPRTASILLAIPALAAGLCVNVEMPGVGVSAQRSPTSAQVVVRNGQEESGEIKLELKP